MVPFPSRYKSFFFFFNDTATTEIYTLPLHDALPISVASSSDSNWYSSSVLASAAPGTGREPVGDRKSTRLNSSHLVISYAVFCLKKKNLVLGFTLLVCLVPTLLFGLAPTFSSTRPTL